ncbi:TIGR02450 family Trp-rich protein [Chromobacterium violaceum]|uniref:TIGR02450 family Trp-rich protein n=1 Tax=Chromobacterium TaxID=535 RepID=UPI000C125310|nr:TIGR02450 family Trp-rich protein [Chromobacterium violaceum]ATP29556.1 TIGR02450 family Trp-rich protein [Chromobacterium violaceum]ATP33462.1 TIGR02450 family Trp-rich protein [Chromobacterium violaceum]
MATTRRLNPEKLLLSKWTAAAPRNREKHFLVVALGRPAPDAPVETVTLEAVHSRRRQTMAWQALRDMDQWLQGWQ